MNEFLEEQLSNLPISRLVFPVLTTEELVGKDQSRNIQVQELRAMECFPNPFYKNISRDQTIPINEDN